MSFLAPMLTLAIFPSLFTTNIVGKLDGDREFEAAFKSLFRTPSDFRANREDQAPLPADAEEGANET